MRFEVVEAPIRRDWRPSKYGQILDLEVGQGLRLPWGDLAINADPHATVRTVAWYYGRRLGRKFRTEKHAWGMLVVRAS